ncbi:MAG: SpoIIE family protein phosphatase [Ruminococcus sp.]|nr:SpoIIE family protein phosphatase [Ruminococcus sp.]
MSVLEKVARRTSVRPHTNLARGVAVHIAYFVSGVLVSRGAVLGSISPFGASFSAAVPFSYMPAGLLGTAIGYLISSPLSSFRYIAIVISIGAIRWVLNEIKKISDSRIYPSLVAFAPVFATALALTFTRASEITELSSALVEALIAAAGAYFMSRTAALAQSKRGLQGFSPQEIACIAMTGCILLLAFSSLEIGIVSIGRILAVLVILLCAKYGSVSVGAIAGIATGAVFSLAEPQMLFLSVAYSLSGLLGGLFSPMGKIAVAVTAILSNVILSLCADDSAMVLAVLIESFLAGGVFLLIPKDAGNFLSAVFSDSRKQLSEEALRRNITMRLSHSAKALSNVSSCVNAVSNRLSKLYTPNTWWIYDKARETTCQKCGLKVYCWEKEKDLCADDFNRLTETLKSQGFVKEKDIEKQFQKRCCKAGELANSINRAYKEYQSMEAARRRVVGVRSVVAGQFSGLSEILEDLSEEFESCESFDSDASQRIISSLSSLGLTVVDCAVKKTLGRGLLVEIELSVSKKTALSKSQLSREVSRACGRPFESPEISFESDRARISLCERPLYDVEIGSAQHCADDADLCGDCLNYFNNGIGSSVALISDGMGTGGRAAVDSNMTVSIMTKLLKAGLSYDCSLAVVNSSLMIKSEEESLATLDITDFNRFTGKAEFLKAGACATYVKKNSKLSKKETPSLPLGILNEAKFSKEAVTLTQDDMIVMISDGALIGDEGWLERLILSSKEISCEQLSNLIVDEAAKRRRNDHDDDITALVMKVVINV